MHPEHGKSKVESRLTRVRVDDQTWADFRQAIGQRHVSTELGKLIEREVARYRRTSLRLTPDRITAAIDDARQTATELIDLVARLEAIEGDERPTPRNDSGVPGSL